MTAFETRPAKAALVLADAQRAVETLRRELDRVGDHVAARDPRVPLLDVLRFEAKVLDSGIGALRRQFEETSE